VISQSLRTATWTIYQDDMNEVWSCGGYAVGSGPDYAYTLVNPVTIQQYDDDGRLLATIAATKSDISGPLAATDSFPQSSYVAWTTQSYDDSGDLLATRVYKNIPTDGSGTSGVDYDETDFGYTAMGLQNMVLSPGGTITRTVYDALNRVISVFVGTDDTDATDGDPTGGGAAGNNMVQVQANMYDDSGVGDSNLTRSTAYVDGTPGNNRVMNYGYDWRNRRTSATGPLDFYQLTTYDNLNRTTRVVQHNFNSAGLLLAMTDTKYDDQNRVFQTIQYSVDSAGNVGTPLVDNTWYDEAGNVIKSQPSGSQAFTKSAYDGLGRQIAQYVGYFATSGVDDYTTVDETNKIFEQALTTYDGASNVLLVSSFQRLHNDNSSFGPLTTSAARVSYTAIWYNSANRQMFSANCGINGGDTFTRPTLPPASSASVLVTFDNYGQDGDHFQTIDPAGSDNRRIFDRRHRIIQTIGNSTPGSTASDTNNTILTSYSPDGQVASLTAVNSTTGDQTTAYTYGTTLADSAIARSDLLSSITYPDGGVVTYEYNRQGQITQMADQNGTVHQYSYDLLGRPTSDSVIALGIGIDSSVLQIARTYNALGQVLHVTSYDSPSGGVVVNDIQYEYNGFQQLTAEYQSHSGAVNTSSTPVVQYTYACGADNTVRLTEITYPAGNGPSYEYGTAGGDGDMLSRVTSIMDGSGPIVDYVYLGLGTFVQVDYPEPGIRYDLAFGSGSNPYAGLDNFGRVIDCRWRTVSTGSDVERIQYGYDLASNRTWRHNTVAPNGGNDELYTYDGLQRLVNFQRGTFSGSSRTAITSQTLQQQWNLDTTGNWSQFASSDSLDSSNSVNQSRTHTLSNEIESFRANSGTAWAQPVYDSAGNMVIFPQPAAPSSPYIATYDAWNRMVTILGVATYAYDGGNRRTTKVVSGTTRHFFYSSDWQALEERTGSSAAPDRQVYWGLRYTDDVILRDRGSERLYCLQDDNWNVTAIVDTSGTIQERYRYSAYGVPEFMDAAFNSISLGGYQWETFYAGYRLESESGLCIARFRHLLPAVGIWTALDPLEYASGTSNFYTYVVNNPIALTDPFGIAPPPRVTKGEYWSATGSGIGSPQLTVNDCKIVLRLSTFDKLLTSPFASRANTCGAGYHGNVACWAKWAPKGTGTDIAGFPDIAGDIGSSLGRHAGTWAAAAKAWGFSQADKDANSGFGRGKTGWDKLLKSSWDAAVSQGESLVRRRDTDKLLCCPEVEVVFFCMGAAAIADAKDVSAGGYCNRGVRLTYQSGDVKRTDFVADFSKEPTGLTVGLFPQKPPTQSK
jgi:RHS repeat-associated protein